MKSKDLKSLCETIATTVEATQPKQLAEGYINSLTEKARQVYSSINEEKDEDEKEESPAEEKAEDKAEMLMKRLAAKALKRAKKKAATNEEVELAEKAAPGYEDWASDPKVKASFKKQYGKDWEQVMYGRSWNMKKMDEETELAEGVKRMRRLRSAHLSGKGSRETADAYDKELSKVSANRLRRGGATKQTVRGFFNDKPITPAANRAYTEFAKRAMAKASAKGKKVFESEQLDEEWGGGFQSPQDAHREVQAGLRRDASIQRRKLVADIKAVHSGKMTKHAFTRKHKMRIDDLPLAKKMAASRAKAKAKYLAKKATKASAPKADSAPPIMEGMQLDELTDTLLFRARAKAKGVGKFKVRTNPSFAGSSKDVPLHKKITQELQRRGSVPVSESEQLDEYQAKRLRIIRNAISSHGSGERSKMKPEVSDFLARSFKKKMMRNQVISGGKGEVAALVAREGKKKAAMKAKGLAESEQLDEAGYKRLMRLKKAAYQAGQKGSPSHGKKMRAAAEQTAKVAAGMARRGDASPDAVRGGGSRIGPSGKYTQKAGKLANQRDRALARFRSTAKIARYQETGDFGGKLGKEGVAKKREMQKGMAKFRMDARHGDFGHEISPQSKRTSMRARYNYEKKYGRLKGK